MLAFPIVFQSRIASTLHLRQTRLFVQGMEHARTLVVPSHVLIILPRQAITVAKPLSASKGVSDNFERPTGEQVDHFHRIFRDD
jgi:hypothetical protein